MVFDIRLRTRTAAYFQLMHKPSLIDIADFFLNADTDSF